MDVQKGGGFPRGERDGASEQLPALVWRKRLLGEGRVAFEAHVLHGGIGHQPAVKRLNEGRSAGVSSTARSRIALKPGKVRPRLEFYYRAGSVEFWRVLQVRDRCDAATQAADADDPEPLPEQ